MRLFLYIFGLITLSIGGVLSDGLIEVLKWNELSFDYETYGHHHDIGNISFIPYNNIPFGVSHHKGRLFVTVPRRAVGIASTLHVIDLKENRGDRSPELRPYPDFHTNQFDMQNPKPNSLVSVYRTRIDDCQRLWFVDTGMLEIPDNRVQVKRPAIWVIDLRTDQVLRRFEIPEEFVTEGRGMPSITVDVDKRKCDEAFAYIPDLLYMKLYVYSMKENSIWAFNHDYFKFDSSLGDLKIAGQSFRWEDGIFSITLGTQDKFGERDVFFHPLFSLNEFVVSNKFLQNKRNTLISEQSPEFRLLGSRGANKQSSRHEYDPRTGIIYYAEIQQSGVGCWNTNRPFSEDNHVLIAKDEEVMIYPSDLTIDDEGTLWVMTNSVPIFVYSTLDPRKYHFRIWKRKTIDAAANTKCAVGYY